MGTGLGTMLLGPRAAGLPGTFRLRQVIHQQIWRRLPRTARRKAFQAVTVMMAPAITPQAMPVGPFVVVGMLRHTCGLGVGARLCYEALRDSGADVYGIDITASIHQTPTLPGYQYRDGSHLQGRGTLIIHMNANMMPAIIGIVGSRLLADKYVIGYWAWELSKVPEEWRSGVDLCHEIWATSAFTADAIRPITQPGQPVRVVHHPVALRDKGAVTRSGDDRFTVLSIFEMASCPERKNPLGVVRAFKLAFGDDPRTRLVLKIGSPHVSPKHYALLREEIGWAPNIECITEYLSDEALRNLYEQADVYISLPRSEGFGLTLVEAMLAGVPVVAPDYSGQADFFDNSCGRVVGYSMTPARDDNGIYTNAGGQWADPSIRDAATELIRLHDDTALRHTTGQRGRQRVLEMFSRTAYMRSIVSLVPSTSSSTSAITTTSTVTTPYRNDAPPLPVEHVPAIRQHVLTADVEPELITRLTEVAPEQPPAVALETSQVEPVIIPFLHPLPKAEPVRSSSIYLGNNLALSRTRFGHKMYVDTRDISLAPHILLDGAWENWIADRFNATIRPGMRVVEIGANFGFHTILACAATGSTGKVTAFEANPRAAEIARMNLTINGFNSYAGIINKAAADKSGPVSFGVHRGLMGGSSLFATAASGDVVGDTVDMITVDCVRLDDYFPEGEIVDFMKIDAEGAEPHILDGAERLLAENDNIKLLVEHSPSMIEASYGSLDRFHTLLQKRGFKAAVVDHSSALVPVSWSELAAIPHCDIMLER